jgi:hypothetical protein
MNSLCIQALLSLFVGVLFILLGLFGKAFGVLNEFYFNAMALHAFNVIVAWPYFYQIAWLRKKLDGNTESKVLDLGLFFSWLSVNFSFIFTKDVLPTKYIMLPWSDMTGVSLFFFFGILVCSLWPIVRRPLKEKKIRLEWLVALILLICSFYGLYFSAHMLLIQNFPVTNQYISDLFWLGPAHLSLQAMTITVYLIWAERFAGDILSNRLRYAFYLYPLFVLGGAVASVSFVIAEDPERIPWNNNYVWLPAAASLLIVPWLLRQLFNRRKMSQFWMIHFFDILPLFSFVVLGGLSGIGFLIYPNLLRSSLGTLAMPGHFHPLVAAGATLVFCNSMKDFFKSPSSLGESLKCVWNKVEKYSLTGFFWGVLILATGMVWGGKVGWVRRSPVFIQANLFGPLGLLLLGASLGFLGLSVFLYSLYVRRRNVSV